MKIECYWDCSPEELTISEHEIHIFRIKLVAPNNQVEKLAKTLSFEERNRAERFYFEKHRRRYILSQGYLREILGKYLRMEPNKISFKLNKYGKPYLQQRYLGDTLNFNISHSHEDALFAITCKRKIGIDIEFVRNISDLNQIAQNYFAEEEQNYLMSISPDIKLTEFFRIWTCKEAYLKAVGVGLSAPLNEFSVLGDVLQNGHVNMQRCLHFSHDSVHWTLQEIFAGDGYAAAVAFSGSAQSVQCWRFGS